MNSSLLNLVDNLAKRIHKVKWKYGHNNEQCEACRIKYKYCECFLEYQNFKDNLLKYNCLCCNKNNQKMFDENLILSLRALFFKS